MGAVSAAVHTEPTGMSAWTALPPAGTSSWYTRLGPQSNVMVNGGAAGDRPAVSPVTILATRTAPSRGVIGLVALTWAPAGSVGIVKVTELPVVVAATLTVNSTGSHP